MGEKRFVYVEVGLNLPGGVDVEMTIGGAWVEGRSTLFLCRHPPANLL